MEPPIGPQLLLQAFLICTSALCSAAEGAVLSLNESALHRQPEEADSKSARLIKAVERKPQMLSAVQLGVTLSGFLASAQLSRWLVAWVQAWYLQSGGVEGLTGESAATLALTLGALLLALVYLVLGRMAPRRMAMQRPEAAAQVAVGMVQVLAVLFRPVLWLLTACTNGVLRLANIDPHAERGKVSEEEIRMMVDIGEEKGAIETSEKELIENIFEFNNMTAGDVMIHRTDMVMLWAEDPDGEIMRVIEETGLSRYPVYEQDADDVVGILNSRDYFLNAQSANPKPVRGLLRPAYFVPESVRADVLFRDMQSKKVHIAIVVDEYGGTSGLVTMEDLLEEIVGNIYDEFDPQDELEIIPAGENLWRVAGSAELEEVSEALGVSLPEDEDSETLGGLIFAQLSVIPEDGSHPEVDVHGLHIQVEKLADRRVEWALVSLLPSQEELL